MNDIYITLIVYLITLISLFIHAHRSRPNLVSPVGLTHALIAIRLIFPFLLLQQIFIELHIDALLGYIVLGCLILTSFIGYLPGAFSFGAACIFYQWTFWFPGRNIFVLKAELNSKKKTDNPLMVGQYGKSKTPLRPSGKILIGEDEYEATCESGFLAAEQDVRIIKVKPFGLVVEEI